MLPSNRRRLEERRKCGRQERGMVRGRGERASEEDVFCAGEGKGEKPGVVAGPGETI